MGRTSLTPEQRSHYEEHGYVVLRGFFSEDEMAPWLARLLDIVEGRAAPPAEMLVMRDVMIAKGVVRAASRVEEFAKIQDFHNDPVLFDGYVRHARLLDVVEDIVGPDIKSVHTMLINKPPNVDGRHPFHQDLFYFPFRPADKIVAAWTALEACTRENGCLQVVPGSHRGELRVHSNPDWEWVNFGYFAAEGVGKPADRIHLEMSAGDTVLFHPLLLHGSGRNRSRGFRRAISAHYASAACRYLGDGLAKGGRPYTLVRGREHPDGL